jgi:2',3'-cyclic-nucleotide 2'-phosphodiesterase (5'-nucleotidase family)
MVNLKNYTQVPKLFVLLLTFTLLFSCAKPNYSVVKIEGKKIGINQQHTANEAVENFIKPYRDHIDNDLNEVLAYCPETLDKSKGQYQTSIGDYLADISLARANKIFFAREKITIDACLLNHGGIRSIIPQGNVTARTAFEIMPFENSGIVVALKKEQIQELAKYIIDVKKPQPLAGITFTIDKNNEPKNILVQGKPLEDNRIYYVVTSDYLSNGGDNMTFFKKGIQFYDIDYKLRNILIDDFKEVDTLKISKTIRITKEN